MEVIDHPDGVFHTGRRVPLVLRRGFFFGDYMTYKYPPPPVSRDWTPAAVASLTLPYENNDIGDCVIAAGAHCEGVMTGNSKGTPSVYTRAQIIREYSSIGGYIDGNPASDKGCNMSDALDYWQQFGFAGGTRIGCWMKVDPTNRTEVQAVVNEFGFIFCGVCLPDAWVAKNVRIQNGTVWDVAGDPNPSKGHCVGIVGYDKDTVMVSSWGMVLRITYAALAKYASPTVQGELYTLASQDWLDNIKHLTPAGLDWSQLTADAASLR